MSRTIDTIVVHHTATRPSASVSEIRAMHVARGWSDVGYHWLIGPEGIVYMGRPEDVKGAHVRGHNAHSIGIALIGRFKSWADVPERQKAALMWHMWDVVDRYPEARIVGHRDLAATECPGFETADMLNGLLMLSMDAMRRG